MLLNLLRLVPGGHVRQLHHVTFGRDVTEDVVPAVKLFLAAVAAALVYLPPDEVHQFHLLVEPEVWAERHVSMSRRTPITQHINTQSAV